MKPDMEKAMLELQVLVEPMQDSRMIALTVDMVKYMIKQMRDNKDRAVKAEENLTKVLMEVTKTNLEAKQ